MRYPLGEIFYGKIEQPTFKPAPGAVTTGTIRGIITTATTAEPAGAEPEPRTHRNTGRFVYSPI